MYFDADQPDINPSSSFEAQSYSNSITSNYGQNIGSNQNVRFSTLEPTAQEFYPSSTNSANGAIKKKYPNKQRDYGRNRNNRYGSGRTFSSSSRSDYSKYSRTYEDRNRDAEETVDHRVRGDEYSDFNGATNSVEREGHLQSRIHSHFEGQRSFESPSRSVKGKGRAEDRSNEKFGKSNQFKSEKTYYSSYDKPKRKSGFGDKYRSNVYYDKFEKTNQHENRNSYKNDSEKFNAFRDNTSDFRDSYDSRDTRYGSYRPGFRTYGGKNGDKFESRSSKDWRNRSSNNKEKGKDMVSRKKMDAASQRERLEEMINCRMLECLVCCEKIKNTDKVWSCMLCYHILHLHCVVAWARSSKQPEKGWRCPACQNVCNEVPSQYKCYCGKTAEPKYDPGTIPHGCGEMCLRKGRSCDHKCSLLCHPGPCPDCTVMVARSCGCGATTQLVKCSTDVEIVCQNVCDKMLECGIDRCKLVCHSGECSLCEEVIRQECYCGKVGRKVPCRAKYEGKTRYDCGEECGKVLTCGNHKCLELCHDGPCQACSRDVGKVHTCPCGRSKLETERASCLDPIPCCDKICGKVLKCGQPSHPHVCELRCHEGDCPPCLSTTVVRCRCGHMDKELPCQQLTSKADDARCEKKCTKKRQCGKHRCNQRCCIEIEHLCPLACNHLLSCGQHRCELTCHSGRCPPCMDTSFNELYCECGASVLFPPIACGTKPPSCANPCSRQRPCGHDVNHNCHTGPCPPCTVLCKRWCYGGHEQRSAVPCYQENFSCGLVCGREMPCGRHRCNKPCHGGSCPVPCKQPCTIARSLCGHPCCRPCHDPPCPESPCKQIVPVTCACGVQKGTRVCLDVQDEFKNVQMEHLKEKMGALCKDQAVDVSDIVGGNVKKPTLLKILECTEECRVLERNRRLAIGLQIVNPDITQKLNPRYSDFMRQWAKKDPGFCHRVHDKLTELVQLAKQSKQKSRSYSFESMNRDKRHFIHEYCEHFGIESEAYDLEPNRNVVGTAIKDKSWLPGMSLLEYVQRENGQRKVPGPVSVFSRNLPVKTETVSLKLPNRIQRPSSPPGEVVDYFDNASS